MLLTILFGAVAARLVFPHLSNWEAGILACILAPTDAGLGQIVVNSSRVPMRIRQALNVEAGLNDGLCVPFLMFFFALAAARIEGGAASLMQFIVEQLGYGVLVGGGIGLFGGWLLGLAHRKGPASVVFMGWFGPRGLASIVLGLVYLEQEMHLPGEATIRLAVIVTVLLSIFAHGLSATPGIGLYTRKIASLNATAPDFPRGKKSSAELSKDPDRQLDDGL